MCSLQHLELSKTLKKVFQEEKQLEDSRKDLQGATAKIAKLQKQVCIEILQSAYIHNVDLISSLPAGGNCFQER